MKSLMVAAMKEKEIKREWNEKICFAIIKRFNIFSLFGNS